ncbi:hypothetical protein RhiirB3_470608 [Rhizophagus irregularis]|nr:hypothetical protein RhiirB3_470608 [Rhizophagus irregularis]
MVANGFLPRRFGIGFPAGCKFRVCCSINQNWCTFFLTREKSDFFVGTALGYTRLEDEGEKKKEDKIEKKRVEKKEEAVDESLIDQVDQKNLKRENNELKEVKKKIESRLEFVKADEFKQISDFRPLSSNDYSYGVKNQNISKSFLRTFMHHRILLRKKEKSGRGRWRKSERKKPEGTIKKRSNVGGRERAPIKILRSFKEIRKLIRVIRK